MYDCRPPDGIPAAAVADTMRLLPASSVALLILIVVSSVIAAVVAVVADEIEDVVVDEASSMCSSGVGAAGSASSVVVRGADGRLATHTLIDVSALSGWRMHRISYYILLGSILGVLPCQPNSAADQVNLG